MTFWTLIFQGFLIKPLCSLVYSYRVLQRHWSGPLTREMQACMSFSLLVVGQEGYAMIHSECACEYTGVCARTAPLPKSPNLQWTRYDWVIKQIKPVYTSARLGSDISPNPRQLRHLWSSFSPCLFTRQLDQPEPLAVKRSGPIKQEFS